MPIDDLLLRVKNRKLVVTLAPVLAGTLIGMTMVVNPSLKRLNALKVESNSLSQKEKILSEIVDKEKRLSGYRERLSKISDKTKFIEELSGVAAQVGLNVLSVVSDEKRSIAGYLDKIAVRVVAEGNYHQLGEFVSRVESMEQFTKILSVEINTEGDSVEGEGAETAAAPRVRPAAANTYKISLAVGLFMPVKDAF